MPTPVGARVGAVMKADDQRVYMFGFGVYEGEHIPPFWPFGMEEEEFKSLFNKLKNEGQLQDGAEPQKMPNPRIRLDNGRVVWGAMCWWGPEAGIRKAIGDREIVEVPVPAGTEEIPA